MDGWVKLSKTIRVNPAKKEIMTGARKYWRGDDEDEREFWMTTSRTIFRDENDEEVIVKDPPSDFDPTAEGLEAVDIEVKNNKKVRHLNKLLRRAKKKRRGNQKTPPKASSESDENEARPNESSEKPGVKSVNVRLKSETSEFELNFRAAPSKKTNGLYNFAVHLGSRLLGYVEVKAEAIIALGSKLQRLQISDFQEIEDTDSD